jgi:putrescine transport system substrate-binding protein
MNVRIGTFVFWLLIFKPLIAAEEPVLNVYSWADYIAPETIGDFEAEFGIEVNYDTYDSSETVEARVLSGRTGYDVVDLAYYNASRVIPAGVFQPLDRGRLPLWGNLDRWVLETVAAYDPGNRFGVPYMWGSTGFAYNRRLVDKYFPGAPVDSADMLFDPDVVSRLSACGVTWLDEPSDVIPMALIYLGLDPNSMAAEDLARAEAQLKSVRPHVRYFSSTRMMIDMPNEDVCVAMSYAGDYAQARARAQEVGVDVPLRYTAPREGSTLWADGMFIPRDAPHPGNAHLFLNYLLRPKVIARITNFIHYSNANAAAEPFVDPAILADPAVYPGHDARDRLHHRLAFGPKQERQRMRMWSRVKTGL